MARPISARHLLRGLVLLPLMAALVFTSPANAAELADVPVPAFAEKKHTGDLPKIRQRKILKALVTHSRTDFFLLNRRPRGLMYEMLREYEKHLNKGIRRETKKTRIVFVPVPFDQLIPALLDGRGDLAAALLTVTPEREKLVDFATRRKLIVNELVVSHKSVGEIKELKDLSGKKIFVLRGSSYTEHLRALNKRFAAQKIKPILIEEVDSQLLTEDILELINAEVIKLTVADDLKARLWAKILPNIVVHENLKVTEGNIIGLAVRKNNPVLKKDLEKFLDRIKKGTLLGNVLFNRYYENIRWIKNPVSENERKKLERYIQFFRKYGQQHGFDYLALAAQAYFESGLDHSKKNEEVANNIRAGVKHLASLRNRYFSDPALTPDNRVAFTWAAYNAGPAKVQKMRQLAAKMGLDPNKWFHHVEIAASRIVGRETVKYVADMYKYYVAYSLAEKQTEKKAVAKKRGSQKPNR